MWFGTRRMLVLTLLASSMAIPAPAYAFESLMSIAASKLAKIMQDIQETAAINAAIIQSTLSQLLSRQSGIESILAEGEKVTAGKKELTQSKLNYQAAQDANERFFSAQNIFLANSSSVPGVCEVMAATQVARTVGDNAQTDAKAFTRVSVKDQMYVENSSQFAKQVMQNYRAKYCTEQDVQRGRCTAVASVMMQGAPLRASTLLTPTSGETYTTEEASAAVDFIQMVTNPVPQEMLPKALESKTGADRFSLAQMHAHAQMSMASGALNHIMATRRAQGADNQQAISLVGMMKDIVSAGFGDSKHEKEVAGTGEKAMYQQINLHLADSNWMDFQAYQQSERIESLLAVQLSLAARARGNDQTNLARSQFVGK